MRQTERIEQRHLVQWFKHKYPDILIVANANGGARRNALEGYWLKMDGVLAGMPDLGIYCARRGYHGMFIELKPTPTKVVKRPRKNQVERLEQLNKAGYYAICCYGLNDAIQKIDWYLDGIKNEKGRLN